MALAIRYFSSVCRCGSGGVGATACVCSHTKEVSRQLEAPASVATGCCAKHGSGFIPSRQVENHGALCCVLLHASLRFNYFNRYGYCHVHVLCTVFSFLAKLLCEQVVPSWLGQKFKSVCVCPRVCVRSRVGVQASARQIVVPTMPTGLKDIFYLGCIGHNNLMVEPEVVICLFQQQCRRG